MGPIDPHQLLKALDPLLAQNGAIKGPNEAARVASLMKDVSKLVSKCIYINILKSTDAADTLEKFIEVGGWNTLNQWLMDCKDAENTPVLIEMLKVYQKLPITVDLLKKNNTAKTIRQLGKSESDVLKNLSKDIVEQWTKKVREKTNNESTQNDASADKKKKSDKKDKERDKEKDKERDREKDSDRDKDRDKEKDKDRDRDKHKHKHKYKDEKSESKYKPKDSEMDTSVLNKKPFIHPEGTGVVTQGNGLKIKIKMDRKEPDKNEKNENELETVEKKRPSTVKRPNTKFRSIGIEEDAVLLSKKKDSPNDINKSLSKRSGADQTSKEEPPEKKSRLNIFTQLSTVSVIPSTSSTPVSTPSPTISPAEVHTKLRITPPKPKPAIHTILDSSGFMDEMMKNDHRTPGIMKRKKKTPTTSTTTTITSTNSSSQPTPKQPSTPTSPVSPTTSLMKTLPSVPSFYQDTLVTSEDTPAVKKEPTDNKDRSPSPPLLTREEEMDTSKLSLRPGETPMETDIKPPNGHEMIMDNENYLTTKITVEETVPKGELKGLLIYSKAGKRNKKKVSWVDDSSLRQFHYFEMDETERENVNRPKPQNFDEMKKQEMILDRKAMESARRLINDNMVEAIPWRRPPLIDGLVIVVESGSQSVEKNIQQEREQHVLQAIFFNKNMLPDSPAEPDMESVEPSDPKFIPLEEENSSGTEEYYYSHDHGSHHHPHHHHQQQQQHNQQFQQHSNNQFSNVQQQNLPPEVSNLLASIQQPGNAASAAAALADTANPVIASVQNLLTSIMGSGNDPHKTEEAVSKLREILDPNNSNNMQALQGFNPDVNQMHPGPHQMQMGPGPCGPGGPPQGMHGPPGGPGGPGPGGQNMPRQGLLGQAPPGFPPVMNQGPGPGQQGPPGPRFSQQGPGMGDQGEMWGGDNMGQNMQMGPGPGPMRGRGGSRGGMRGGRMPHPGHMGQQGPPQGHPGQQGPGGPMGPHNGPNMGPGGPNMGPGGPGGPQMGPGGPGGPPMGPGGPGGPPMGPGPGGPSMRGRGGRAPKERPVCRHFAAGGCRRGNTCSFLHPGVNGPPV